MQKVYKQNDIKIKHEIDRKISIYSHCIDYSFK